MDLIFDISGGIAKTFSYLPWILGGGFLSSIIAILILWFVAPHIIPIIAGFVKPIAELASELFTKTIRAMVHGFKDIFDDPKTILTFFIAIILVFLYNSFYYEQKHINPTFESCKPVISELRKEYKFIKRRK
jgi:uncharacterized membrane protein YvlD (DUF360 family)